MFKLKIFPKSSVLWCLLLLQITGAWSKHTGRIWGGEDDKIENVPYVVQIFYEGSFACAGTLIADNLVVSAADCLKSKKYDRITVKGAATTLFESGSQSKLVNYMLPKSFNVKTGDMNVALLRLKTPLEGVKLASTCQESSIEEGAVATIYGWGYKNKTSSSLTNVLQKTELKVIDNKKCEEDFSFTFAPTEVMFCATAKGKGSCYNDYGGPVIINNQFCGIISSLPGCVNSNVPGVFTNVLKVQNFIDKASRKRST